MMGSELDAAKTVSSLTLFGGAGLESSAALLDRIGRRCARTLEILCEAGKQIPSDIQLLHPTDPRRRIAWLRDVLAHAYFVLENEMGSACHQAVKHPPESLVQSSRCVKDRAMRPVGASLSPRCG